MVGAGALEVVGTLVDVTGGLVVMTVVVGGGFGDVICSQNSCPFPQ